MVGLDQDLMQKNLLCNGSKKKNVCSPEYLSNQYLLLSVVHFFIFMLQNGIEVPTDLVRGTKNRFTFS
jgi:hypothetical protein